MNPFRRPAPLVQVGGPPKPNPPTPQIVQVWISELMAELQKKLAAQPNVARYLAELPGLLEKELTSQKSYWPEGWVFPPRDMVPFQRNLWRNACFHLHGAHPDSTELCAIIVDACDEKCGIRPGG